MNEELKKKLSDLLSHLIEGIEKSGDFLVEQAPLFVQEIILFGRVQSSLLVGWGLCMVLGALGWIWYWLKEKKRQVYGDLEIVAWVGGICIVSIGILFIGINFNDLIQSWLAPRIYLIKYLKGIL